MKQGQAERKKHSSMVLPLKTTYIPPLSLWSMDRKIQALMIVSIIALASFPLAVSVFIDEESDGYTYECPYCGRTFNHTNDYLYHMEHVAPSEEKNWYKEMNKQANNAVVSIMVPVIVIGLFLSLLCYIFYKKKS